MMKLKTIAIMLCALAFAGAVQAASESKQGDVDDTGLSLVTESNTELQDPLVESSVTNAALGSAEGYGLDMEPNIPGTSLEYESRDKQEVAEYYQEIAQNAAEELAKQAKKHADDINQLKADAVKAIREEVVQHRPSGVLPAGRHFFKELWNGTPKVYTLLSVLGARALHALVYRPHVRKEATVVGAVATAAAVAWYNRSAITGWFKRKVGISDGTDAASAPHGGASPPSEERSSTATT